MADTVGRMEVVLAARIDQFERNVERAQQRMERAAARMNRSVQQVDDRMAGFGERFGISIPTRATIATAAIAGVGLALRSAIQAGEQMRALEGRFKALTGSAERAAGMVDAVLGVSSRTGDTLSTVSELQSRFLLAARELGATDEQIGRFTESLLKLGRIGGSSTEAISAGTMQLAQGLAGGVIRAEEFNSLMENTPLIVQAIADSMGVTLGEMRALMLDGRLLANDVFQAILSQSEKIDAKFQEIPQTSGQAWTRASNAMALVLAQLDDAVGVSSTWVDTINAVADGLERSVVELERASRFRGLMGELETRNRLTDMEARIAEERASLPSLDAASGSVFDFGAQRREEIARLESEAAALRAQLGVYGGGGPRRGSVRPTPAAPGQVGPYEANPAYTQMMLDAYSGAGRGAPAAGPLSSVDIITHTPPTGSRGRAASLAASDVDRAVERLQDMTRAMVEQAGAVGKTGEELTRYRAAVEAANMVAEASAEATPEQRAELERLGAAYVDAAVATDRLKAAQDEQVEAARNAESAVDELTSVGERLSDALLSGEDAGRKMAMVLAEVALNAAGAAAKMHLLGEASAGGSGGGGSPLFGLLGTALSAAAGSIFGGGVASPYSGFSTAEVASQYASYGAGRVVPSALGNVFSEGRVIPFANGGIVDAPTFFPMARGAGLMAEAGPEAIMPLERGAGGKLGVRASGGGAVDVRVYMDKSGNWQAEVERISGNVAAKTYDRREPGTINRVGDEMRVPGSSLHTAAKGAAGGGFAR